LIARKVAIQNVVSQFPKLSDAQIQQLIQELCQEKQIIVLDEGAPLEEQIICIVPQQKAA
jgi:MinD-like ATPase involved in chromosome partitioning or flagellar assembly